MPYFLNFFSEISIQITLNKLEINFFVNSFDMNKGELNSGLQGKINSRFCDTVYHGIDFTAYSLQRDHPTACLHIFLFETVMKIMVTRTGCGLSLIFTTMEPWSKTVWGCSKFLAINGETGFAGTDLTSFVK